MGRSCDAVRGEAGDLGMALQRRVAWRGFIPARHHADERLGDVLLGQAHGVVVRAVRGALRPLRYVTARQFGFVEGLGVH